jgi:hypothetical protein
MGFSISKAFSFPSFTSATSAENQPLARSNSAPIPGDSAQQNNAHKGVLSGNAGGGMRARLAGMSGMFRGEKSSKPKNAAAATASDALFQTADAAEMMLDILNTASRKFDKNKDGIETAVQGWVKDDTASLEFTLNKFNKPKPGVPKGTDQTDGLRSGVTGMLNGIGKPHCLASPELKARAKSLEDAVIFKTSTGKAVKLIAFASPGDNGTRGIDNLKLSAADKEAVAARFSAALDDMQALGQAYTNNATEAPPAKFDPKAVITVGGGHEPGMPTPAPSAATPRMPTGGGPNITTPIPRKPVPSAATPGMPPNVGLKRSPATATRKPVPSAATPSMPPNVDLKRSPAIRRKPVSSAAESSLEPPALRPKPITLERSRQTLTLIHGLRNAPDADAEADILAALRTLSQGTEGANAGVDAKLVSYLAQFKPKFAKNK